MSENARVTRAAGKIGAATFLSRVLGFIRDMVVAKVFGADLVADAFFVAFRIPNLLRELFAEGSMSAVFIPVLTEYLVLRSKEEARDLANALFNILLFMLFGVMLMGIAFTPAIVTAITPGFLDDPEKFEMTVSLTRIMFPYVLFIGLAAVVMGVLNSLGSFTAPALSPVMLNISMIGFALFVSPSLEKPIFGLAFGVVVGGMLQFIMQIPPVRKKGFMFHIMFRPAHEGVRKVGKLAVPVMGSMAVNQLNIFASTIIASYLAVGSISYLYYASRLYQFPHGIFGIAIATALLPSMSRQAAKGEIGSLRDTMSFGMRYILFINIPAMVGLIVLGEPITSLLFQRGKFDYTATQATAYALNFYALGLWAYSSVRVVNSAFYALKDTKTPVKGAAISVVTNIGLSLLLMGPLKHGGLALAAAMASSINVVYMMYIFRRNTGRIGGRKILASMLKTSAASAVMGVACFFIARSGVWAMDGHTAQKVYLLALSISSGIAVYTVVQYMLRSEELAFIFGTYRDRLRR